MVFALNLQKGIFESNLAMSHICRFNNIELTWISIMPNIIHSLAIFISLQIGFLVQKHGLIHDAKFST